jgi:hypothetical protein
MNNNSNITAKAALAKSSLKDHYTSILVFIGTMFSLLTFIILCRPTITGSYLRPTLYYMHAMATFSTLILCKLYVWYFYSIQKKREALLHLYIYIYKIDRLCTPIDLFLLSYHCYYMKCVYSEKEQSFLPIQHKNGRTK